MSTSIRIKQVDAFTDTPMTGNPAGIVPDASGLTDREMQYIAREFAVPESAFVLPPSTPSADVRLRWFTPTNEVPLCGHATIGSFHALAEAGMRGMEMPGVYTFRVETRSGILPVSVTKKETETTVEFGLPVPEFERAGQHKLDIVRLLGIPFEEVDPRLPIVSAGYIYMPVRRLHTLFECHPNFPALGQFLTNRGYGGLCVFTTETVDRASAVHSRFFAPHQGIPEDPVTGSANGPLGVYLFEQRLADPKADDLLLIGEQGDVMGRRGRVTIHVIVKDHLVQSVTVGGRAVTVVDGTMTLPGYPT
jgi:trans-2,3-dihydro-3-hydroxyanthranilate isomerase